MTWNDILKKKFDSFASRKFIITMLSFGTMIWAVVTERTEFDIDVILGLLGMSGAYLASNIADSNGKKETN